MHKRIIGIFITVLLSLMFFNQAKAIDRVSAINGYLARLDTLKAMIPTVDSVAVDSLGVDSVAVDSLGIDSLGIDSTALDSVKVLTKQEIRAIRRDSIRARRDSIIEATPRILETYAIPDSLHFKKIITWNVDPYFNKIEIAPLDSTFRDWNTEYQFMKEDINGTYLGVIGSATEYYSYFKRKKLDILPYYAPYLPYAYTPETIPQYNTKSPYTELAYWGTLFSYKDKEELSVKFLHTQNITPALNFAILYQRYGGAGLLQNEATDNRSFAVTVNHLGKRYIANAGYISNSVNRTENGGLQDPTQLEDPDLEAKAMSVNLSSASNKYRKYTGFIKHSYVFPINLSKKQDSLDIREKTQAIVGHVAEFSTYSKKYLDQISSSDEVGRGFYNNQFFIHPTNSADSMRLMQVENKFFIRLQPWAEDAIVSKVEAGVSYQHLNYYNFDPNSFLTQDNHNHQNNFYVYAGASGRYKKYLTYGAFAKYTFAGYSQNDLDVNVDATFSFYPFKDKKKPVNITAIFETDLTSPDWYSNYYYSNHFKHENNFNKTSEMKIKGQIDIPSWDLSAFVGYSLSNDRLYYDTLSIIRQHTDPVSILSASIQKNFKVWYMGFDNQILFQTSSRPDIVPLPMLALRLRWYFEFPVVKNVMTMQIGADATFNTAYYVPAYNPALGVFHNQEKELIGNNPHFDIFVNVQWKTACIFVKFLNAGQGWPKHDYFSAYHYIKPQQAFKFGIFWPFYIK